MARARAGVAAMVAATLLWGGTFVAIRDSVRALTPAELVFGRFGAAALLLAIPLAWRWRAVTSAALRGGVASGALMAGGYFLQAEGLTTTSAGSSAFLTSAGTLTAGLWAWLLLRERPGARLLAGLAAALAGSALLSLDRSLGLGRGELLTLAGALLWALQILVVARFAARVDAIALTAVQVATITVLVAPAAAPGFGAAIARLDAAGWWRFAYLAVAGSTVATFLQVWAQRTVPPGRVGLLSALEPVFALLFAVSLGAERFAGRWWAGAALILAATVWVELAASPPGAPTPRSATSGAAGTPPDRSGTA